jgi:hypothetical protein
VVWFPRHKHFQYGKNKTKSPDKIEAFCFVVWEGI